MGSAEETANFEAIAIQPNIETDATKELFDKLRLETERRCPIYQLFQQSSVLIPNH
ncbi:hypothetical protein [Leptolyngbya sp. FACHB-16]|uniref:hypothetical protein n=1 Tax=unclassified Leptolyngbya TaxID=2650499 RepID=UPI001686361B|nr:hypothetical protein [Leptolyngbya sp. FACHB-16]MBD2153813.1 hypothetical protein [Leptolyngbya sp. FACHB-16]